MLDDIEIKYLIKNLSININRIERSDLHDAYNYIIKHIKENRPISQPQYKFLCWLNNNDANSFPIEINKPHLPEIVEISVREFSKDFCTNLDRIRLFEKLLEFLKIKNSVFNCEYLDLLI